MNTLLQSYIPIAKLIGETFGENCEVIIHDFSMPINSVVYTINNQVTHREVGQSFTEHLIRDVLLSRKFSDDCAVNYVMNDYEGKTIKSSTALIRDLSGKAIGALCVNIDITQVNNFTSYISNFFALPDNTHGTIDDLTSIQDIVDDIIDKIIGDKKGDDFSRDERIELLKFMYDKGIFSIKGSVDQIADRMNISKVTVYSYLDEIRKGNS